jgi:hypothetical protein
MSELKSGQRNEIAGFNSIQKAHNKELFVSLLSLGVFRRSRPTTVNLADQQTVASII